VFKFDLHQRVEVIGLPSGAHGNSADFSNQGFYGKIAERALRMQDPEKPLQESLEADIKPMYLVDDESMSRNHCENTYQYFDEARLQPL